MIGAQPGDLDEPVPVGVGLEDRHHLSGCHVGSDRLKVGGERGPVHLKVSGSKLAFMGDGGLVQRGRHRLCGTPYGASLHV